MSRLGQGANAVLTVDLAALASNYRLMQGKAAPAECAAVVKADAYGLGAGPVARALRAAGCATFFVAHVDEGIHLREALGEPATILVLHGLLPGSEADFLGANLVPVLNTLEQVELWNRHAHKNHRRVAAALQVDSGMTRLGLDSDEVGILAADPSKLDGIDMRVVMSHLACADDPLHPANRSQLRAFKSLAAALPRSRTSLANSSGIFLGTDYHLGLVRPGAALYGINPTPQLPTPVLPVVELKARVVQVREVKSNTAVGYGLSGRVRGHSRLATVSIGYADGWLHHYPVGAQLHGHVLPLVGRVSMDSIVVEMTDVAGGLLQEGTFVNLVGPDMPVDEVAALCGTIGYEVLTSLGPRIQRRYKPM